MGFFLGVWVIVVVLGEEEVVVVPESDAVLEPESDAPQLVSIFSTSLALSGGVTPSSISSKICVTFPSLVCSVGIGQRGKIVTHQGGNPSLSDVCSVHGQTEYIPLLLRYGLGRV